jgi:hypothetical protein
LPETIHLSREKARLVFERCIFLERNGYYFSFSNSELLGKVMVLVLEGRLTDE